jgi:hypothetical protein
VSNTLLNWAWEVRDLTIPQRLVLVRLCDRANGNGRAWPSVPNLARDCGMSSNAARTALHALADKGLITLSQSRGRVSNSYVVRGPNPPPDGGLNGTPTPHLKVVQPPTGWGVTLHGVEGNPKEPTENPHPRAPVRVRTRARGGWSARLEEQSRITREALEGTEYDYPWRRKKETDP